MIPLAVAGLGSLALRLVPELLTIFASDKAGTLAGQAADMIRTATGTDDPKVAQNVLAADPDKMAQMRVQLATIVADQEKARDQARLEEMRVSMQAEAARLAGVADARKRDLDLQQAGKRNVRADVMVGLVLIGLVIVALVLWLGDFREGGSIEGFFLMIGGGLFACFKDAFNFEFGSSRGSREKDQAMERIASTPTGSAAPAIATNGDVNVGAGAAPAVIRQPMAETPAEQVNIAMGGRQ